MLLFSFTPKARRGPDLFHSEKLEAKAVTVFKDPLSLFGMVVVVVVVIMHLLHCNHHQYY